MGRSWWLAGRIDEADFCQISIEFLHTGKYDQIFRALRAQAIFESNFEKLMPEPKQQSCGTRATEEATRY